MKGLSPERFRVEEGRQCSCTGRQQNLCCKLPGMGFTSGVLGRGMILNGMRRNLGDPAAFLQIKEDIGKQSKRKGAEMSCWKSDRFIVEV